MPEYSVKPIKYESHVLRGYTDSPTQVEVQLFYGRDPYSVAGCTIYARHGTVASVLDAASGKLGISYQGVDPGGYHDLIKLVDKSGNVVCFGRFTVLVDKMDTDDPVASYKFDELEEEETEEEAALTQGVVSTVIASPWTEPFVSI